MASRQRPATTETSNDGDTDADGDSENDSDDSDDSDDTTPGSEEDCTDGLDEDQDGLTDCEDADCAEACVEDCADKVDNDQDGLTDCDDDDCVCTEEDCGDGVDDDKDGLLDCEDDDCVDACVEDCSDDADNDQDGLTDCDDDECYGIDDCGGPYTVSARLKFSYLAWAGGPDLSAYLGYGYNVAMRVEGAVELAGYPDGWKGSPFYCTGSSSSVFQLDASIMGLTYVGSYMGVDYAMGMQLNTSDRSLQWYSGCPVSALPYNVIGLKSESYTVYLNSYGKWYSQYTASEIRTYPFRPYDFNINYMYSLSQRAPIEWVGVY